MSGRYINPPKSRPVDSRSSRGFTLIELLVVTVIIAVIAAIAIPKMIQAKHRAKWAALESYHASEVRIGLEMFYIDNGRYPDASEGGGTNLTPFLKTKGYITRDYADVTEQLQLQIDGGSYTIQSDGTYLLTTCVIDPSLIEDVDEDNDGDACLQVEDGKCHSDHED